MYLSVTNDGNNRDNTASSFPNCVYLTAFSRRQQLKHRAAKKCSCVLFFSRFNPQAPQARDSCNPKPDSDPRSDPEILVRERDGLMSS